MNVEKKQNERRPKHNDTVEYRDGVLLVPAGDAKQIERANGQANYTATYPERLGKRYPVDVLPLPS